MANILVAVPCAEPYNQRIVEKLKENLDALHSQRFTLDKVIYTHTPEPLAPDALQYTGHAASRNALIDQYLRDDHDFVLWIDADLISFPTDLVDRLHISNRHIVAPTVFVTINGVRYFYDTHGFRQLDGSKVVQAYPHFNDRASLYIPMLSVGCCYLIPADIYRRGIRYSPTAHHTEHWSVMQSAIELGYAIVCDRNTMVWHANLVEYGEIWHEVQTV